MTPEIIQAVFAPMFLLLGLSHLVQPQLWVRFFEVVSRTGVAGCIIPMYTLPIALVLIVGHNIWVWDWPLFLTIAGWGMTIKCAVYLLLPRLVDRVLEQNTARSTRSFQIAGALMTLCGGMVTWHVWLPTERVISP